MLVVFFYIMCIQDIHIHAVPVICGPALSDFPFMQFKKKKEKFQRFCI